MLVILNSIVDRIVDTIITTLINFVMLIKSWFSLISSESREKKFQLRHVILFFISLIFLFFNVTKPFLVISETTYDPTNHLKVSSFRSYVCSSTIPLRRCKYHLMLQIYHGFHNHVAVTFGPSSSFHRSVYVAFLQWHWKRPNTVLKMSMSKD